MPAPTERARRFMGAAYERKMAGHPRASDPHMTTAELRKMASKRHHTPGDGTGLDGDGIPSVQGSEFVSKRRT